MFDVLCDALRALRIHGTVLLRETYRPPFAVAVSSAGDLASKLEASRAFKKHLGIPPSTFRAQRDRTNP